MHAENDRYALLRGLAVWVDPASRLTMRDKLRRLIRCWLHGEKLRR